jgi:mRNA-degrading endonuclease RelE of RelBE toxin-antitoxin system
MDRIEKLFRKILRKDRDVLQKTVSGLSISSGWRKLKAVKLKNSDFYKLRKGRYRIIFHLDKDERAIIDSVKLRNEKTYKNL